VFDLQAKVTAVTVDRIAVDITASNSVEGGGAWDIVSALRLYLGDTLIGVETLEDEATEVTFEDLDSYLAITKDAKKTLTVTADVYELPEDNNIYNEGDTILAAFSGIEAEDANENDIDEVTGAAEGEDMYLYTVAPELTLVSASLSTTRTETIEEADGTLVFKVTALGGDVYVNNADDGINGVVMAATDGVATETYEVAVTGATETDDNWRITEGNTATFTVSILLGGDLEGDATLVRASLDDLEWNTDDDAEVYNSVPDTLIEDFRTSSKSLNI